MTDFSLNDYSPKSFYLPTPDGQSLYAESYQNTKRPEKNIILTHGFGGNSNAVLPLAHQLLKTIPSIQCIVWDLRGHGYSTHRFPTTASQLEDVAAADSSLVIEYFQLKKYYLVGHSLGGLVTQQLLFNCPQIDPEHTFLIASPIRKLGWKVAHRQWFKLLVNSRQRDKRSTDHFHRFAQSGDFSLLRAYADISTTGLWNWIALGLAMFGWRNNYIDHLDDASISVILAKYDRFSLTHNLGAY